MADILLVDDDRELCELLAEFLGAEGFTVRAVHDGFDGVHAATRTPPDLVICDVMMPGIDGLQVLRDVRAESDVPVLMLTAKRTEADRIAGLELGADDYLAKPFNPRELVARIRAVLRRAGGPGGPGGAGGAGDAADAAVERGTVTVGDLELDRARRRVTLDGADVDLTATELDLLACLVERPGDAVDRGFLFRRVLSREPAPDDRSLDMMVSRLRRKLGPHADGRRRIQAVRSVGYLYVRP